MLEWVYITPLAVNDDDKFKKLLSFLGMGKENNNEEEEDGVISDEKRATDIQKDVMAVLHKHKVNPNLVDLTIVGVHENTDALAGFTTVHNLTVEQAALYFYRTVPTIINMLPQELSKKEKIDMFSRMMLNAKD